MSQLGRNSSLHACGIRHQVVLALVNNSIHNKPLTGATLSSIAFHSILSQVFHNLKWEKLKLELQNGLATR